MQFESKIKREYWINSPSGLIPDLVIAAIFTVMLGGYVGTFMLVIVGLQVLYFLVWLRKTIWSWIVFGVWGRRHLATLLTDYLTENEYPEPEIYERSAEDYFTRIATHDALMVPLRLKATGQAAALRIPSTIGEYQYAFRVAMAYEDALMAHKRTFADRLFLRAFVSASAREGSDRADIEASADTLDELNMHCEYHLLHVANFDDVNWKKADQEHDLRGVLVAYCAAIDGTQDAVNTMFKPYEDKVETPDKSGLFQRIKQRKLKHLMQLRNYFEFKLKLQLLDNKGREKFEPQIREMLRPEVAEQV
jgi:hypothetical protein